MMRDSSGSSRRNAATVSGASSSSRRATNEYGPAVTFSTVDLPSGVGALGDPGDDEGALFVGHACEIAERHRLRRDETLDLVGVSGNLLRCLEHDAGRRAREARLRGGDRVAGGAPLL